MQASRQEAATARYSSELLTITHGNSLRRGGDHSDIRMRCRACKVMAGTNKEHVNQSQQLLSLAVDPSKLFGTFNTAARKPILFKVMMLTLNMEPYWPYVLKDKG